MEAGENGETAELRMSKARPVTAEELASFDAFAALSRDALTEIAATCKVFLVAQGWVLQRQGVSAKALFFIR